MNHVCPVCGYPDLAEPPRRRGGRGSYEVCPSCGFQFGVSDDDARLTYEQWRALWKKRGLAWSSRREPPPAGWNAERQLASLTRQPRRPKPR